MNLPAHSRSIDGQVVKDGRTIIVRSPETAAGLHVMRIILCILGSMLTTLLVGAWLDIIPAVTK